MCWCIDVPVCVWLNRLECFYRTNINYSSLMVIYARLYLFAQANECAMCTWCECIKNVSFNRTKCYISSSSKRLCQKRILQFYSHYKLMSLWYRWRELKKRAQLIGQEFNARVEWMNSFCGYWPVLTHNRALTAHLFAPIESFKIVKWIFQYAQQKEKEKI